MAVDISIERDRMCVTFSGEITTAIIRDAVGRLHAHDGYDPEKPRIWDFAGTTGVAGLSSGELGALALLSALVPEPEDRTRVAIVVSSNPDFGVARMFQGRYGPDLGIQLRIFRDRESAEEWVTGLGGESSAAS